MQPNVTEVAADIFRISTFHPDYGIQLNQFLVKDDEPFLMHTGFRKMFRTTLDGVARIADPRTIRWIGYSHFEPDECGALNEWLGVSPQAQAVCSMVSAIVMLNDFSDRPARPLADGEALQTGRHRLRFLATPHVPHAWDAGLFFDESEGVLLCSDLFFQPGDPPPVIDSGLAARARESIESSKSGPLANDMPYTPYTDDTLHRLAALNPRVLATMHGSSFVGDGRAEIIELAAGVRELLGRSDK
ncbi:MAG TPA: hypothetical protein VF816_06715 [Rhodocyclaceae bacterium]